MRGLFFRSDPAYSRILLREKLVVFFVNIENAF